MKDENETTVSEGDAGVGTLDIEVKARFSLLLSCLIFLS
jgi:hypothetical protein